MSDPYSPYQPPSYYPRDTAPGYAAGPMQFGWRPQPSVPGIVRAAAVMLGIFGILVLGGTVLLSVAMLLVPMDDLAQTGALDRFPPEVDPRTAIQYAAACMGVCGGVVGLIYLVLTPFVWKGNRGGIVAAAVVVGLTQLMTVVLATANFLQGGGYGIAGGVFYLAIAAVLGVALLLLIKSVGALHRREEQLRSAAYQAGWQAYHAQRPRSPHSPGEGGSGWGEPPNPPPQE